jgi:glucose-1-phosphate cytidylyltransferase
MDTSKIPVVILCGGRGLVMDESGRRRSKALIPILNQQPILRFVMQSYLNHGFRRFILSVGEQEAEFFDYFKNEAHWNQQNQTKASFHDRSFELSIIPTGPKATTGDRISGVASLLANDPIFAVTYSDTLSNLDLTSELQFHLSHGKVATLAGARIPTRFRILGLRSGDLAVRGFASKPVIQNELINGGFYFFTRTILQPQYLGGGSGIVLEEVILERLAEQLELMAYPMPLEAKWHDLDSERSLAPLAALAQTIIS